jgi:hypothetical protein
MRSRVVTTTCDRCHVETDVPMASDGEKFVLPEDWLHVSGITATKVLFTMDLCPDCKVSVMTAAGMGMGRMSK